MYTRYQEVFVTTVIFIALNIMFLYVWIISLYEIKKKIDLVANYIDC